MPNKYKIVKLIRASCFYLLSVSIIIKEFQLQSESIIKSCKTCSEDETSKIVFTCIKAKKSEIRHPR